MKKFKRLAITAIVSLLPYVSIEISYGSNSGQDRQSSCDFTFERRDGQLIMPCPGLEVNEYNALMLEEKPYDGAINYGHQGFMKACFEFLTKVSSMPHDTLEDKRSALFTAKILCNGLYVNTTCNWFKDQEALYGHFFDALLTYINHINSDLKLLFPGEKNQSRRNNVWIRTGVTDCARSVLEFPQLLRTKEANELLRSNLVRRLLATKKQDNPQNETTLPSFFVILNGDDLGQFGFGRVLDLIALDCLVGLTYQHYNCLGLMDLCKLEDLKREEVLDKFGHLIRLYYTYVEPLGTPVNTQRSELSYFLVKKNALKNEMPAYLYKVGHTWLDNFYPDIEKATFHVRDQLTEVHESLATRLFAERDSCGKRYLGILALGGSYLSDTVTSRMLNVEGAVFPLLPSYRQALQKSVKSIWLRDLYEALHEIFGEDFKSHALAATLLQKLGMESLTRDSATSLNDEYYYKNGSIDNVERSYYPEFSCYLPTDPPQYGDIDDFLEAVVDLSVSREFLVPFQGMKAIVYKLAKGYELMHFSDMMSDKACAELVFLLCISNKSVEEALDYVFHKDTVFQQKLFVSWLSWQASYNKLINLKIRQIPHWEERLSKAKKSKGLNRNKRRNLDYVSSQLLASEEEVSSLIRIEKRRFKKLTISEKLVTERSRYLWLTLLGLYYEKK